eukprot:6856842-Ditylum_brightwellii.AAC.1
MSARAMDNSCTQNWTRQQGGKVLPVLAHLVKGYDWEDIFQWELVIQRYACGVHLLTEINKVGKKVHERLELDTFPKKQQM